jgi:ribosome-associated toxin RatA of RatAB toxin-antitoxin module
MRSGSIAGLIAALMILSVGKTPAIAGIKSEVVPVGTNEFRVTLQTEVRASSAAVWKVLTDYDNHSSYLPYLVRSKVLFKSWEYSVVEQAGKFRVLFWSFQIWVKQKVTETPMSQMEFQALEGDFSNLAGAWTLEPTAQGTTLVCQFTVQPKRRVPTWAVRLAVRRYLANMVKEMAARAEKSEGI